jgi:hypothetical protein
MGTELILIEPEEVDNAGIPECGKDPAKLAAAAIAKMEDFIATALPRASHLYFVRKGRCWRVYVPYKTSWGEMLAVARAVIVAIEPEAVIFVTLGLHSKEARMAWIVYAENSEGQRAVRALEPLLQEGRKGWAERQQNPAIDHEGPLFFGKGANP